VPVDFEALLANSPNPYVLLDRELRLVWMNEAYLRTTMRDRAELVGKGIFEAFPSAPDSESHRLLEGSLRRVLSTGEVDELALIRYDISRPDGSLDARYWSATHTPLKGADGAVRYILQHTVDVTELHDLRALRDEMVRDEMGIVRRAHAVQARNLDLAEETDQLRSLLEQAPGFAAVTTGPEHRFQIANRAYSRLVAGRDVIGKAIAEALPEVVEQGFITLLDEVMRTGEPYVGRHAKVMLRNAEGNAIEERYLDFIYQPIIGNDGRPTAVFVQGHDVTEEVEAGERQKLLINELNHRVKNTLAVVQGLSLQTFKDVAGAGAALGVFDARLNALAAAHGLLTASNWQAASLIETVRTAIGATAGSSLARVHVSGADFTLQPQAALSLAMLVHELSTNAIKYGALSNDTGRIDVVWTIEDEDDRVALIMKWVERDGPSVTPPTRHGFGTRLVQRGISSDRRGNVMFDFAPEGLRCTITATLPKVRA
jgi:PAS domain S-box-containing protein